MKNLILFFTLCLFATTAMAQTLPATTPATPVEEAQPAEGPLMDFETTTMDYGTIEKGSDPLRKFHFTNTGTEPLVITHAKGSCGCTVPTYPKEPIMPGEASVIEVRYDTKRVGKFSKSITLTTNAVDGATKRLMIKGHVKAAPPQPPAVPASQDNFLNNQ